MPFNITLPQSYPQQSIIGIGSTDGITLIFNQQFDQYKIVEIRLPRSDIGTVTPFFEVVSLFDVHHTRGPFSAVRARKGAYGDWGNGTVHYKIYAQSSNDPAVIFEFDLTILDGSPAQQTFRSIVSQTNGDRAPARGGRLH